MGAPMTEARLVASGTTPDGKKLRVIAHGTLRTIEICKTAGLGEPSWQKIGATIDLVAHVNPTPPVTQLEALLHVLDDVAAKREALAKTMTYGDTYHEHEP